MDSWWQTGSLVRLLLSANAMQVVGEKRADVVDTWCRRQAHSYQPTLCICNAQVVGEKRADIVDTWWQTETGMHMITPLPGATPLKAGAGKLLFWLGKMRVHLRGGEFAGATPRDPQVSVVCCKLFGARCSYVVAGWHMITSLPGATLVKAALACSQAAGPSWLRISQSTKSSLFHSIIHFLRSHAALLRRGAGPAGPGRQRD